MTPEVLRSLIAGAETLDVEFKGEEACALSDGDLVEAVVCLANRPGNAPGWLLVGVEDDGRITGARPRHADRTDPLRLQALIAHRTRPSLSARVESVRLGDRDVIAVEVPAARAPVGTSDGKPACLPLHFHEMQGLQADRGLLDYSALVVPDARWDDLDPLEFERFRRFIRESQGRSWHLSAATYRRLGEKAAYVHQRSFEPMQQEQMVLQYVETHGRITRAEAAGLCKLSPDQVYRLLQRLTESGRLTRHGTKKGAWYERRA